MSSRNKRIAHNTLMLYIRMILVMGITLYTSRIVLKELGVENYGIYNVVGGVVAMFNLLVGSLRAATQRFITFELGKSENRQLKRIFSASVTIHFIISIVIFILAESIGIWFLNTQMNIPVERMVAANWVFQCSVFTFIINLISVPYNAAIIAYEKMSVFAYISVVEVILSLIIVYLLALTNYDKLIVYALLLLSVAFIIRLIYVKFCASCLSECKFSFLWDKLLFREMFSFIGWNFIGAGSGVLMTQGVNIVLNIFCGVTINAARGIATQVQTAVMSLTYNFMTAFNPQITKSFAAGENEYLQKILRQGAKFSYLLMLMLALPILMETKTILSIWLNKVPEYTVVFVRLIIVYSLILCISTPLVTAMLATGKIKSYQIIVGGFQLLNFPFSFVALMLGASPVMTYVFQIVFEICCLSSRLWLLREMIGFETKKFIFQVLQRIFLISIISLFFPMIFIYYFEPSISRFVCVTILSIAAVIIFTILFGLSHSEKSFLVEQTKMIARKIQR